MRHNFAGVVFVFGLVTACSGGSDDQFYIVQNQVPEEGCVIPAGRSNIYRGSGVLDVALVGDGPFAYRMHPLLQNDFPAESEGEIEPNRLILRGFSVRVKPGDEAPADIVKLFAQLEAGKEAGLVDYDEPWSGSVDPGGATAASVTVIPGELARRIRDTKVLETLSHIKVNVRIRALARRGGGTVKWQEFVYPISVCQGCLISQLQSCPFTPVNMGNACNLAQDEPVDCCTEGGRLFCPSQSAEK